MHMHRVMEESYSQNTELQNITLGIISLFGKEMGSSFPKLKLKYMSPKHYLL